MVYWFFLLFFLCLFLLLLLLLLLLSILLFLFIVMLLVLLFLDNRLGFLLCLFHRHAFSYKLFCHASNIGLNITVLTRNFYLVVFVKRLGFFLVFFYSLVFLILLKAFIDGFQIGIKCLIDIIVESMFFHQTDIGNVSHFYLVFLLIILDVEDIIVRHSESWYLSLNLRELLGNTLIGYFFHILRGILFQAIAVYVIKNFLFSHLAHEFIGSSITIIINHCIMIILIEDIIIAILFGIFESLTLLQCITLVIHLGLLKNLLVIALLLQIVKFLRIIC